MPRIATIPATVLARRLMVAVVVALGWGGAAGAATHDAKAGHHCACAERCKGAACCCPADSHDAAPAEVKAPTLPAPKASDGPCAGSAPCGHPDLPAPGASRPISRAVALLPVPPWPTAPAARLHAASDDLRPPLPPTARLDDPPEA
jgi:hypothetical protein